MFKRITLLLFLLPAIMTAMAGCPEVKLKVKRLPDLNVPRAGHAVFVVNGELTVVGGHTSGFVPTATAEYYGDGEWHLMPTVYTHDQGLCVPMSDGRVMLAGGHEKELGIGQTFTVELYHPTTHSFEGYGCLDKKRTWACGIELDSGHVVISGNWYGDDGMEVFDGTRQLTALHPVAQQRTRPYILRTAKDNAIVFSACNERGDTIHDIIIDRIKGEPFTVPLFRTWRPKYLHHPPHCEESYMGHGTYLLPVEDSTGQIAIAQVQEEKFSLLPTDGPVPMTFQKQRISYFSQVIVDSLAQRAYLVGHDDSSRLCVLSLDCTKKPAALTLHYTEPMDSLLLHVMPILTPDGNLALIGGIADSNFQPSAAALLLCVGTRTGMDSGLQQIGNGQQATTDGNGQRTTMWLWIIGGLLLTAILCAVWFFFRKQPTNRVEPCETIAPNNQAHLMQRLRQQMDEQKPYLNSMLKLQDVADMLNTNRTYIADCIKAATGQSFTLFVNTYRVENAKQLLTQHPNMKMSAVWAASGFATEASFFRTFKAVTGTTPNEWKTKNTDSIVQNPQID